nr:interferon alpha-inducible protein 27-like protein 2A isoform X1 [Anas platyrhynchos]
MKIKIRNMIFLGTAGVGLALLGAPAIVSALGFKAGGVTAGSAAAKMMSAAAIATSGGVAAGSIVAVLPWLGALVSLGSSGHYQKGELEGLGRAEGAEPLHCGELASEPQDSLLVPKWG